MNKVLILKGLPASGKSTFAKQLVEKDGNWIRANKDEIRSLLYAGAKWTGRKEKLVEKIRDEIIRAGAVAGKNVVVDDTNLNPRHEAHIRQLVNNIYLDYGGTFPTVEVMFFPIDPEEAVKRDLSRPRSVGADVIWDMWNRWLRPSVEPLTTLGPSVVICDLDGTLALFGDKNAYDRDFENDRLNTTVAYTLKRLGLPLIITSGRNDKFKQVTEQWLLNHEPELPAIKMLLMRKDGDVRKDSIVKREMYETEISGKYNVFAVFDDRDQVVRLWRELGLTCFQVADGKF
jgi:predicted kinase